MVRPPPSPPPPLLPPQLLTQQADTSDGGPMSEADRRLAAVTEEALTQCSFEDIFTDSKFLKQGEGGGGGGQW